MNTQSITEAILNVNPGLEPVFRAFHIISKDRPWKPKPHPELNFIKYFYDLKILVIISKQIHTYLIGDLDRKKNYHIINLEGYHADYFSITFDELTERIKDSVSEPIFLPDNYYDRIIYYHKEVVVFNRVTSLNKNMFTSGSKWTVGADNIYDVDREFIGYEEKNTNANQILNEIYSDCQSATKN